MTAFVLDETRKLTAEQRSCIAAALGNLSTEEINVALAKVQFEMQVFVSSQKSEEDAARPKEVNDALRTVLEQGAKLSQAIAALPHVAREPLEMNFNLWQLRAQKGSADPRYISIQGLNELLSLLTFSADDSMKRGKPTDHPMRTYIWQLATIFRQSTGKLPTRSVDPERLPRLVEGGIARKFFGACLDAAGYSEAAGQGHIQQALKRLRSMDINPNGCGKGK
jgi:hypothetical protein